MLFCALLHVRLLRAIKDTYIHTYIHIFQLIVDFWHMLPVNDDDDVGFSLAFYTILLFCIFFVLVVRVWVCT